MAWIERPLEGWRYSLRIDTDTYAGNFDEELSAAATGLPWDPANPIAENLRLAYRGPDLDDLFGVLVDQSGFRVRAIRVSTPGAEPGPYVETTRSVVFPFRYPPPPEILEGVVDRIEDFARRGVTLPGGETVPPFGILAIVLVRERIVREEFALPPPVRGG